MKTRDNFNKQYPELNKAQQQAAYMLSEIDGWSLDISETAYKVTLSKEGKILTLDEKGNAL